MQVIKFDRAALRAKGMTDAEIDQGHADLDIILGELARDDSSPVAMTKAADAVLHDALDAGLSTIGHDATAWGTAAYDAAWGRTVQAFGARGIVLDTDPAAARADGRDGAMCFLTGIKAA